MMSHIKVISSTTYHIVFAKFGELSMELYAIKLAMGSTPVGPPTFNLVSLSFPQHLAKQGVNTWHETATMWQASWGLSHWETHGATSKITFDVIKEAILAKEWNFFHLSRKKLDNLHSKIFSNTNVNCT